MNELIHCLWYPNVWFNECSLHLFRNYYNTSTVFQNPGLRGPQLSWSESMSAEWTKGLDMIQSHTVHIRYRYSFGEMLAPRLSKVFIFIQFYCIASYLSPRLVKQKTNFCQRSALQNVKSQPVKETGLIQKEFRCFWCQKRWSGFWICLKRGSIMFMAEKGCLSSDHKYEWTAGHSIESVPVLFPMDRKGAQSLMMASSKQ